MTLIKIMQILLIMINRKDIVKQPMANKVFELCLKSLQNKSPLITSNVFAVIQQMYTLLFELYSAEGEVNEVCCEHLGRLISLVSEKKKHIKFKGLALDCITMILSNSGKTLSSSTRIQSLFETSYVPSLSYYLANSKASFTLVVRVAKTATQLMLVSECCYILLQPLLVLSNSQKTWQRYLALEAFGYLLKEPEQIQRLHKMLNRTTNMRVYPFLY